MLHRFDRHDLLPVSLLLLLIGALACEPKGPITPRAKDEPAQAERPSAKRQRPVAARALPNRLSAADKRWVRSTMSRMSLEQKAAQLVMVRAFGRPVHPRAESYRDLLAEVRDKNVGGVVVFDSDLATIPRLLNRLQAEAEVPLLVACDVERGMAFRVPRGTTPLPYAMALGAARSEDLARRAGEITAREGRALGIHWAFAPVADVNVNPANPVINIRSFGERPALVSQLSASFIRGVRDGGMLATAKHFPGHGDTSVDSHFALPTVTADRDRLEEVELAPFREAVAAGVDAVMLGHLSVPSLDPSGTPATLSRTLVDTLLREEIGFDGLIVTDAMEMAGIRKPWPGAASVAAVAAGADVVLLPPDTDVAIQALVRAVMDGSLSETRLDASVVRVLETKARLGLRTERMVELGASDREIGRPEDLATAAAIAETSITVVRNRGDILPLHAEQPLDLLHLVITDRPRTAAQVRPLYAAIDARQIAVRHRRIDREVSRETLVELVAMARKKSHVVVSAYVGARTRTLTPSMNRLLEGLHATGTPMIVLSLDSPYLLAHLPDVPVYLCTFGAVASSQEAAIAALFGEIPTLGTLPVTLPGLYAYGHGIQVPRHTMSLETPVRRDNEADDGRWHEVDRLLEDFLAEKAFPGGVLAVGHHGHLVKLAPFGHLSYDDGAPAVTPDTMYDLASLTKVIATTTMAMMLVDDGRIDLDSPVGTVLPSFRGPQKDQVTVAHLLTHSSGIDWWAPLYEELKGPDDYLERILAMDLVYEPGSRTLYSDLGLIVLGEVLRRAAAEPLDTFTAKRVFAPLGMHETGFRPLDRLDPEAVLARVAPTENDPWRGRVLQGEVHDENASALGGVAPHAGLFGTAPELARFAQMILNGGVFEHRRLVSRATVDRFTTLAGVPGSTRALGWDTKSPERSSAGTLFSPSSFGHTGYTGTSLWIDPERQLFVLLLTNRVHPSRENILIRMVRPAIADAVVRALAP